MYYLGVDLGGTNIVAGVVDENYRIVAKSSVKTACPRPAGAIADDIIAVSREACRLAGTTLEEIAACGIGSPGTLNPETGVVGSAKNLGFSNLPLAAMLNERSGKKFYLENDANAAAYGEFLAGAGKGTKNFIAITLGTGVGGGVIIDGKLFSGSNYAGAEIGHTVICVDGAQCSCGRKGCFEAYSSATALIRQTKDTMIGHRESMLWQLCDDDIEKVNGKTVFDAAQAGDATAKEVLVLYQKYLAAGITNMINLFQPERICIGGGISNQGENLIAPVREIVSHEIFTSYLGKNCEVLAAQLGNDAGVIGAAMIHKMHETN